MKLPPATQQVSVAAFIETAAHSPVVHWSCNYWNRRPQPQSFREHKLLKPHYADPQLMGAAMVEIRCPQPQSFLRHKLLKQMLADSQFTEAAIIEIATLSPINIGRSNYWNRRTRLPIFLEQNFFETGARKPATYESSNYWNCRSLPVRGFPSRLQQLEQPPTAVWKNTITQKVVKG